jgi:hypothetical protein
MNAMGILRKVFSFFAGQPRKHTYIDRDPASSKDGSADIVRDAATPYVVHGTWSKDGTLPLPPK